MRFAESPNRASESIYSNGIWSILGVYMCGYLVVCLVGRMQRSRIHEFREIFHRPSALNA